MLVSDRVRRAWSRHTGLRGAVRLPRWAAGLGAVMIVGIAVALAIAGVPKPISGIGDFAPNLLTNLATGLLLGLLAYLWFFFWTSERTTHDMREMASRSPERLFPVPPRIGTPEQVVGREELIEEVVTSLTSEFRTGPQVVVGKTGSGKTSFLLGVAAHLARERGVLPIVLTLRDADEIDIAKLAQARFDEYVEPRIRASGDKEKLWRWMCRRRRIVVLADDLDRAKPARDSDPYKGAVRTALGAARRRDLPLVVASRAEGVPAGLEQPPVELPPLALPKEKARDYVLERAGRRSLPTDEQLVADYIDGGRLMENPFYLGLLATLLRKRVLQAPPDEGQHGVRIRLLETWRASLLGDRTVSEAERARRESALVELESFAAERLSPDAEDGETTGWLSTLHEGERFGIVLTDEGGRHRFVHEVVHAYLASRALQRDAALCDRAIQADPDAPRVQLALVLAAAASRSPEHCRNACRELLSEPAGAAPERHLMRATAAAEVARAGRYSELDDAIANRAAEARVGASTVAKTAAVRRLARLGGERAVQALRDYAGDDSYDVRWAAVETLVERCSRPAVDPRDASHGVLLTGFRAYGALTGDIERGLNEAQPFLALPDDERPDDWIPEIVRLKQIAWMLPALRTSAATSQDTDLAATVSSQLDHLLRLEAEGVTRQRGLEASLAQGFKLDARLHPEEEVDRRALEMLGRAAFWYSHVNLLHAIALRAAMGSDADGAGRRAVEQFPKTRRHPYAKAAARMCRAGIEQGGESVRRYVWSDEGVLVSKRPSGLADEAAQLAGDITVLLNLNEVGDFDQRDAFGNRLDIPVCMGTSRDRREFIAGCADDCDFRLCPLRTPEDRLSAHREISREFCRHQRLNADSRLARHWGSQVRQGPLREFWSWLEYQARI